MTHSTPEYVKVTAWQNFRYNIYDWIASHGWFFAFLLAVFFLTASLSGCAADGKLFCLEGTGACLIEREGYVSETVMLRSCDYPGGSCYATD